MVDAGRRQVPVAGLRSGIPGQDAAGRVEDRAAAVAIDDRDLDALLVAEGGRGRTARTLASASSKRTMPRGVPAVVAHERRVRDDQLARVGRAVGLGHVHLAGLRARASRGRRRRCARRARAPLPARACRARREPARGRRGRSPRPRRRAPASARSSEPSARLISSRSRGGPSRDAVAERGVTPESRRSASRVRANTPPTALGLAVGLQGKALVEAGTRLARSETASEMPDEREQRGS